MEVFISWSGERSKIFAEILHEFIQRILHPIKPWISTQDIEKGTRWNEQLSFQLSHNSLGIICVTPENQCSAWLMFEAGAIAKTLAKSRVFPILIGLDSADLNSPLNQFQSTNLEKEDFYKLLESLNNQLNEFKRSERILRDEFELRWESFYEEIQRKINNIQFQTSSSVFPEILNALKMGLSYPEVGTTVQFKDGFETHIVYESVFKIARNRLYIFGRKNRKVFDKEHWWFFEKIREKAANGLDFKCLFLDPEASDAILIDAHEDTDFKDQLRSCVTQAQNVMQKFDIESSEYLRTYKTPRAFSTIIADEAVLFKPIEYNESGRAKKLTKTSFTLTSSATSQGKIIVDNFLSVWKNGTELRR